jgi:toxin HigB-1
VERRNIDLLARALLPAAFDFSGAAQAAPLSWHKGLKKLYEEDNGKALPPDSVDKLRKMLAFLDEMENAEELRSLPTWKVHPLTGDRKGTWSLSVTRNLRLTFRLEPVDQEICDLNLEDYH